MKYDIAAIAEKPDAKTAAMGRPSSAKSLRSHGNGVYTREGTFPGPG